MAMPRKRRRRGRWRASELTRQDGECRITRPDPLSSDPLSLQGMACAGEAIQLLIPEGLIPSTIRKARAIADRVIDIVGFVDKPAQHGELMAAKPHRSYRLSGSRSARSSPCGGPGRRR